MVWCSNCKFFLLDLKTFFFCKSNLLLLGSPYAHQPPLEKLKTNGWSFKDRLKHKGQQCIHQSCGQQDRIFQSLKPSSTPRWPSNSNPWPLRRSNHQRSSLERSTRIHKYRVHRLGNGDKGARKVEWPSSKSLRSHAKRPSVPVLESSLCRSGGWITFPEFLHSGGWSLREALTWNTKGPFRSSS